MWLRQWTMSANLEAWGSPRRSHVLHLQVYFGLSSITCTKGDPDQPLELVPIQVQHNPRLTVVDVVTQLVCVVECRRASITPLARNHPAHSIGHSTRPTLVIILRECRLRWRRGSRHDKNNEKSGRSQAASAELKSLNLTLPSPSIPMAGVFQDTFTIEVIDKEGRKFDRGEFPNSIKHACY